MRFLHCVVLLVAVAVLPVRTAAQATDSLPLRAGQWGAEFSAGNTFHSAGLLRFFTSRRALVLDVVASITNSSANGSEASTDDTHLRLRLGHRWYRPIHPRIAQFASVGASFSRSSFDTRADSTPLVEGNVTGGGIYADLGAAWFVSPHLSLGATWTASVDYSRRQSDINVPEPEPNATDSVTRWQASAGAVALRLNLYF